MKQIIAGVILSVVACGSALAQSTAPAPGSKDTIPEKTAPATPDTDIGKKGGSLSQKLNSSNGVIRPEGSVDPGMQKPAPTTEPMPVVPPPGSPGGKTDVQPK
jgi:hypothetical protein